MKSQIAGDLLDAKHSRTWSRNGHAGARAAVVDQAEPVQERADERNERVDLVSRGMLGLTIACARCHDHEYDPISQMEPDDPELEVKL